MATDIVTYKNRKDHSIKVCLNLNLDIEEIDRKINNIGTQEETTTLLAKTLIEVRKHMTAHIPEKVFDMVDDALSKSGFQHSI